MPSRRRTPARGRIISGRRIYFCATPVETFARWPCLRPDAAELQHDGELFLGAENNSARLQSRLLRFGHAFGQPPPDASTRRNFLGAQNHSARKIVYVGPFRLVQWREDMAKCMFLVGDFENSLLVWHKVKKIRGSTPEIKEAIENVEQTILSSMEHCFSSRDIKTVIEVDLILLIIQ